MSPVLRHKATDAALALALAALVLLPLVWASVGALLQAGNAAAWQSLALNPQLPAALGLTLWTGLCAAALSLALTAYTLSRSFPGPRWQRLVRHLAPMLAIPHAAFAIGLVLLIAPSGWLLRLLSPWATGLHEPPPWPTTQDPWGLGLIAVLVAKEVPFLLWAAAAQLQRPDVAERAARELTLARTLGYSARSAWWRVLWPQLRQRLHAPMLAVLVYSLTVVDMALVIGPGSPPTLAVLTWQWLQDADSAVNAQGAAAAWLLAALAVLAALVLRWARRVGEWVGQLCNRCWPHGGWPHGGRTPILRSKTRALTPMRPTPFHGLLMLYLAVMLALVLGSVIGVWPFPQLWPQSLSWQAWASVAGSTGTLWTTVSLAALGSATALLWAVAWLECAPPAWRSPMQRLLYLPLLLPSVLWVLGLHQLSLAWGWDAHYSGLWLAHSLAALPYVLIALAPAYLGFDARHAQITATLGQSRSAYLLRVKWPLLKAALLGALAVGFAVSVAQYLPTLFIGAGRFNTVTTEAVTLASGAQRTLSAAYAWLQWLLPVVMFAIAAWLGRPQRFAHSATPAAVPGAA